MIKKGMFYYLTGKKEKYSINTLRMEIRIINIIRCNQVGINDNNKKLFDSM